MMRLIRSCSSLLVALLLPLVPVAKIVSGISSLWSRALQVPHELPSYLMELAGQ
jgi:hypothetical protein